MHRSRGAITSDEIEKLVGDATVVGKVISGGQKAVVPVEVKGTRLALKIVFLPTEDESSPTPDDSATAPPFEEITERARREVRILSQVQIPQLARTGPIPLGEGVLTGVHVLFYSEEWIDGVDLSAILKGQGKLQPAEVTRLGIDVCAAISWLWENSKVHRDIKPANIMRRRDGTFVLLDLGFALDLRDRSLTSSGFVVGTPRYFSPEHLDLMKKRNMDFRSDMYCLGVTMYEVATGRHPFYNRGMGEREVLECVLKQSPIPPSGIVAGFPDNISDVIMRMIAKFPHLRYQSCDKLREALIATGASGSGR